MKKQSLFMDSNPNRNELQRRAKELLEKRDSLNPQEFERDLEVLMENIQVYHIELEMQNQELIRLQEQLGKSNTKFQTLFNRAPVGYCMLTLDGDLIEVNEAFADFVSLNKAQIRGKGISAFVHPHDQDLLHLLLQNVRKNEVVKGETLRFGAGETYLYTKLHMDLLEREGDEKVLLCSISDISSEVAYRKKLVTSEARFHSLISSMDDLVFSLDIQQRFTGVYGRWVSQMELTPKDFLGRTATEIFGSSSAQIHSLNISEALKGKNVVYEWSVSAPNGEQFFQTSLSPIYDEKQAVVGVVGLGRDITSYKQAIQLLKASEEKYRNLVENVNDIIYSLSPEGFFMFVSTNWPNILGHNLEEVQGKHFTEFVHPDDIEICQSFLEVVTETKQKQSGVEYRVKHKDGSWRWHHSSGSVNQQPDGSVEFIGVAYDVTEIKTTQNQLKERIKEIDCLYKITTLGNESSLSLDGFIQRCVSIIPKGFQHPDRVAVRIILNQREYSTPNFIGNRIGLSAQLKIHEDHNGLIEVELQDESLGFLKEEELLLGLLAETISQVVMRYRATIELFETNENLNAINAEKDKILTIIAHDLRGPLSTIIGLSEYMKVEVGAMEVAKQQMFVDGIHKTAKNLSQLLDNLLVWVRLKRGSIEFKPRCNNLFRLAESASVLFEDLLKKKQVTLSIDISKDLQVLVDARMVETVFRNLLSNAIKFSYREGYIVLSAKPYHDGKVLVSLTDNGVGMDDYILGHLFKFDNEAGREGTEEEPSTGFGMPLCKELVEKNNGEIWAESKEGKESTIFFTLPKTSC